MRRAFGFAGGVGARAILAALVTAGALAAVLLAERWPAHIKAVSESPKPPVVAAASGQRALRIEATYPVERWTVTIDGVAIAGGVTTATTWRGASASSGMVQILAEPQDPLQGPGALRISGPVADQLAWGEGTVSARFDWR